MKRFRRVEKYANEAETVSVFYFRFISPLSDWLKVDAKPTHCSTKSCMSMILQFPALLLFAWLHDWQFQLLQVR